MITGTNSLALHDVTQAAVSVRAVRAYDPPPANVPTSPPPYPGRVLVFSFRPRFPQVLAGDFDTQLATLFSAAPPDSWWTAWHEGEAARFGLTSSDIRSLHSRLYPLFCEHAPPTARYGQIFEAFSATPQGRGIVPFVQPGLDFYGLDSYGNGTISAHDVIMPAADEIITADSTAQIEITECNSPVATNQALFISQAFRAARQLRSSLFLTYFGTGKDSIPFSPSAPGLVDTLHYIAKYA